MTLRKLVLIGSLATVLGGCVVAPAPHANRTYYEDRDYYYTDDDYYDYYSTPSYEGYYYVRVIFIGNIPYYVDDDRHVRPIPRHLHTHFLKNRHKYKDRHAPWFDRDNEVRDGYHMSRVIYFNNVPYYVENGRAARPLPNHMHERFRYSPRFKNNNPPNGNQPMPLRALQGRPDDRRNEPPGYDRQRDRDYDRGYDRDRDRDRDRDNYSNGDPRENERQRALPNFLNRAAPSNDRDAQPQPPMREERMSPDQRGGDDYRDRDSGDGGDPRQNERQRVLPGFLNRAAPSPNGRDAQPSGREERMNPPMEQRGEDGPRGNGPMGTSERGREDNRPQANRGGKDQRPARKKSRGDEEDEKNNGPRKGNWRN